MSGEPIRRRRAFTLVEILSVIGIILILAGITFPVLAHARERARFTVCASNSAQLSKAMLLYLEDSGGLFARESQDNYYWLHQLKPYGVTQEAIKCPDFMAGSEVGTGSGWALNVCLQSESAISASAGTVMFTETTSGIGRTPGGSTEIIFLKELSCPDVFLYSTAGPGGEVYNMRQPFGANRHSDRSNYAFVDGHVANYPPSGIRVPYNRSCSGGLNQWIGPPNGPTFRPQGKTGG